MRKEIDIKRNNIKKFIFINPLSLRKERHIKRKNNKFPLFEKKLGKNFAIWEDKKWIFAQRGRL